MKYAIQSHPTLYNGVWFRSRLVARWACFFDLVGWTWEYEPIDLDGWTPDFRVEFPCAHSECYGSHALLVEVKPYYNIFEFDGHRCMDFPFGVLRDSDDSSECIPADASAAFGINPDVTQWEMSHGSGGGIDSVKQWVSADVDELWKTAGNIIRGYS